MKALLADHEAQVVQDQLRLQLRQGRLNTPPSASTLSANAYDMLSSGAAGGAGGGRSSLSLPGGSAAAAAVAAEAGNSRASLEGASLSSAALLLQQQQQQSPASQRARMLGLGGSQPQSQHGSLLRANGTASSGGMNNVILPNGLREESMFFGKISRETSAAAAAVDVALDVQSRQGGNKKYDDGRGGNENSKLDDDHPSASLRDSSNSAAAATANAAEGVGEEPEEEDEEDRLDDDEYFRRHHPPASGDNAGSSNEAGGNSYPMAREAFPLKLYRILYEAEQNEQDDIISFFPHGRAFAVHKSKEFTRDIMPKYFPAGRMNTFLKQLNLYGFRRITEGRDKGGYFHKDFLKGKRHMCKKIKRKKVHVNKAPPPTPAQHAPAFFSHPSFGRMGASNLPFLDQLSSTFGSSSNLSQQQQLLQHQQQLLQQQQQQQQQLLSGLQLSGSASNAASMFGNAAFNRERLLLASSSTENVAQNYMQDLSSPSSVNNSARLHPANFQNFNGNNHPNLR
ncbi:stress transcription factor B-2b [Seminavis robusta]|uniref:Stress transcription factor B-2b n=1 Tax=Seminavis robusta TaxID=568900 RepID=A0A9N8F0X5_9STRA|nr:stress transcription factor B-2b [Seminavis robusta]|eukprot:Sro2205_g318980.1 stress transcription factor B-2b (511) ;mRNA; f:12836-14466